MKSKPKRRMLLIGVGGWGAVHLDVYCSHPGWQVTALADIRDSALQAGQLDFAPGILKLQDAPPSPPTWCRSPSPWSCSAPGWRSPR